MTAAGDDMEARVKALEEDLKSKTQLIEGINERLESGDKNFESIGESLKALIQKVDSTNEMVKVWDKAKGFVAVAKWVGGITIGIAVFYQYAKDFIKGLFE